MIFVQPLHGRAQVPPANFARDSHQITCILGNRRDRRPTEFPQFYPIMKSTSLNQLVLELDNSGFAFVHAHQMRAMLERLGSLQDWKEFASSWSDLAIDTYLAAQGHVRLRRYAVYSISANFIVSRLEHQPHYQSESYNRLQGGIDRWFEPVKPFIGSCRSLHAVLLFGARLFTALSGNFHGWRVEVHQFRIEANQSAPALPTPEGVHRDGVDYVLVLLVDRENISSGTTTIHSPENDLLGSFTLRDPLDTALLVDFRVLHGVTMIHPLDREESAWRDVLVVTFKRTEPGLSVTAVDHS